MDPSCGAGVQHAKNDRVPFITFGPQFDGQVRRANLRIVGTVHTGRLLSTGVGYDASIKAEEKIPRDRLAVISLLRRRFSFLEFHSR